jgi:hypothetical protein
MTASFPYDFPNSREIEMIDINTLRFEVRLNKLDNSQMSLSPLVVEDLLDRIEAAESDALEQARLNGMGASREAALMAKLEVSERDIALKERVIDSLGAELNAVAGERDALRARIEAMERQKPVASIYIDGTGEREFDDWKCDLPIGSSLLYLAPGAQPAPSVPEDVMRDAERYRYLRARDDGTAGVGFWIEAEGRACDRGWLYGDQLDSAIDTCIEMLAAAPEARP